MSLTYTLDDFFFKAYSILNVSFLSSHNIATHCTSLHCDADNVITD